MSVLFKEAAPGMPTMHQGTDPKYSWVRAQHKRVTGLLVLEKKTLSSGTADAIDLGRVNGQSCMRLYSKCIA